MIVKGNQTFINCVPSNFFLYEPTAPIPGLSNLRDISGYQKCQLVKPLLKCFSKYIDFENINTIFDVGSRDCLQTIEFKMRFPNSHVHAFEANPKCIDMCEETLKRYEEYSKKVTLNNFAATDYTGEITFYPVTHGNIGASSLLKVTDHVYSKDWTQCTITVPCQTLDSYCIQKNIDKIDILWMDVQGAELKVFLGMDQMLNNTMIIHTEVGIDKLYDDQVLLDELNNFLLKRNFVKINTAITPNCFEADVIYINKKYLPTSLSSLYNFYDNTSISDTSIILQGPTNYINDMINCYGNCQNVVFSTWETEKNNIPINTSNINMVLHKEPSISGYHNINFQAVSTREGINYAKQKWNTKYMLKIRSDIVIPNISAFITILEEKIVNDLSKIYILAYQIGNGNMWPIDYIVFGTTEVMEKYWNIPIEHYGTMFPEQVLNVQFTKIDYFNINNPGDKILFGNYYEYLLKDINESGLQIYWLSKYFDKYAHPTIDNCIFINRYEEDPFYGY